MGYVFISHSKDDKAFARSVIEQLKDHGIDSWIDDQKVKVGKRWWEVIVHAIRDCSAFLLIMTDTAAASDWVNNEILVAKEYNKPIFPLWHNGDPRHPTFLMLANIQYFDVRDGRGLDDSFFETLRASMIDPAHSTATIAPVTEWQPNTPAQTRRLIDLYPASPRQRRAVQIGVGAAAAALLVAGAAVIAFPGISGGGAATSTPTATLANSPATVVSLVDQPFSPQVLIEWRQNEGLESLSLNPTLNRVASDYLQSIEIFTYDELVTWTMDNSLAATRELAAINGYAGAVNMVFFFTTTDDPIPLRAVLERFVAQGDPFMADYTEYGYLEADSIVEGVNRFLILILGDPDGT
ncbi:MAG: toll/interleukin-1 receptor domain-containing protein [bacterium]|nr:toll/interleukin-1 receptor domain-containing protein [bacterium]